jgi:Cyclin, N-terminal domain/Cyclin, C-terminal domain
MMGVRSASHDEELMSDNVLDRMKNQPLLVQMLLDEVELKEGNQIAVSCVPNEVWRNRVLQWFYDVVDHLSEARSVIYIAVYILDCYVSQKQVLDNRTYQLCSLTSLFLACRINGSTSIRLTDLIAISQINGKSTDFSSMMKDVLSAVKLCKRFQTPHNFVIAFVNKIRAESTIRSLILEEALYNCDMCVSDYNLSHTLPSEVAVAAIAIAVAVKAQQHSDARSSVKELIESTVGKCNLGDFRRTCSLLRHICDELHEDHAQTRKVDIIEEHCNYSVVAPIPVLNNSIIHVISMDGVEVEDRHGCAKRNMVAYDHTRSLKSRRII